MNEKKLIVLSGNELAIQNQILNCNQNTERFGVVLSEADAAELMLERRESLKRNGRVELKESILPRLIIAFCDSAFIYQDNYVETLGRLQDIFYLYKSESMDILTDDELIAYMRKHFEADCQGSLDYLEDTCLENFARRIREKPGVFMSRGDVDVE